MRSLPPPFFIVGCDRSGTTLLRLMLSQSPLLHIPQESGFLDRLCEQQDGYGDFAEAHQRWFFIRDLQTNRSTMETKTFPIFDLTIREAEAALRAAAPTDLAGASAALFAAAARKKGKPRWADKTPRYVLCVDWLAQAFPEAQFVHLIRDGRDVALSIRRAGWQLSLRAGAVFWKERVEAGCRAGAALPSERYREVRYEDLVTRPEATLQALCSWLDLPYTSAMLSFHEKGKARVPSAHANLFDLLDHPVNSSRAYGWKRQLKTYDIADVEDVAGSLLADLGYERTNVRVPLWLRGLRAGARLARPALQEAEVLTRQLLGGQSPRGAGRTRPRPGSAGVVRRIGRVLRRRGTQG